MPSRAVPCRTLPGRAEPRRAEPSRAVSALCRTYVFFVVPELLFQYCSATFTSAVFMIN